MTSRYHRVCTGEDTYPLAVGYVRGVRSFSVWRDGAGTLGPATYRDSRYTWEARGNVVYCNRNRESENLLRRGHPSWEELNRQLIERHDEYDRHLGIRRDQICDDDWHSCGLWAYHDGSRYSRSPNTTSGVIRGYGRTTIGERGFRASRADIEALVVRDRLMTWVGYPLWTLFTLACLWVAWVWDTGGVVDLLAGVLVGWLPGVALSGLIFKGDLPLNLNVPLMRKVRRGYAAQGVRIYSTRWLMLRRHPVDRQIRESGDEP